MAVGRIHRTVYPWGTGPIGASGYPSFTKTETRYHQSLDKRQLVSEERCYGCFGLKIGCFVTNRLSLRKKGCFACNECPCSLSPHARKDIDYHERLANGQTSEDILPPQTQPTTGAIKEHRTVYRLGTGPRGNNPDHVDIEMKYYNNADVRQLITKAACSRCSYREIPCFVTMQIGSDRRGCYTCGDKFTGSEKCSLRMIARRDIDYRELLPSGEVSEAVLVPRVGYSSKEAIKARQDLKKGLIPCIPDHIPTTPGISHTSKNTITTSTQEPTDTAQAVVTPSIPSGSTIAPDPTPNPPPSDIPASASLRVLRMVAERELETMSDLVPSISAERDRTPPSSHSFHEPEMSDLTHSSESSSPPSSDIEAEPTIPVGARVRHPMIRPTSDSTMIDRTQSPEISSSINSHPRVPSEIVFHLIAINNSKDPRAHEASTLRFQERQMSVRVYSNQYDGPGFDYGPATRNSDLGRGPRVGNPSTSGGEGSDFAGTENEKLLKEIEDTEMENVHMNSQLRRERLKANAKAMREMKGDGGYEKALKWELQKKRREQQARNDEIDGELTKSSTKSSAASKRKLGQ